ncbi:type I 3-dehydroquinate dehydratase [Devriesea agamarum]|uniref:type I 3-dehydroquinate dehydratase n=1 Tax=Devriesea agamarum TaxID=472569 RepID=UPI00071D320E|nr:type I 3-dehydroquinate dehydratase [Devriesea agamarum]
MQASRHVPLVPTSGGRPAVIVSLTGVDPAILRCQARAASAAPCDIVEWRVDLLRNPDDLVPCTPTDLTRVPHDDPVEPITAPPGLLELGHELRALIAPKPLLLTVRTRTEGGAADLDTVAYAQTVVSLLPAADAVDIELNRGEQAAQMILKEAVANGVFSIASFHDFGGTPSRARLHAVFSRMHTLGVDAWKVAVTPGDANDVLRMLTVCREVTVQNPKVPVIAISMGSLGVVTRIAGHVFGSAATFAALGDAASAPGQLDADRLCEALDLF